MKLRSVRNERGAALVEFALVFPFLFLAIITVLTMLWMLAAKSAMSGAARDGARYASIRHDAFNCDLDCDGEFPAEIAQYPSEADIAAYVNDRVGSFGPVTVEVDSDATDACDGAEPLDDADSPRIPNSPLTVTVCRDLPVIFQPVASIFGWDALIYETEAKVRAE